MMNKALILALAVAAESSVIARSQCDCSFKITTNGPKKFPVGQTDNGQTKASPNQTPSKFCLNGNTLLDGQGRGCWFTPPSKVLQCDTNQVPSQPFTIDCNGIISYQGSNSFYQCPSGTGDIDNILLQPDDSGKCEKITLSADGCHTQCTTSKPQPPPSTSCPAAPPAQTITVTHSAAQPPPQTVIVTQSASTPSTKTVTITQSAAPPPPQTVTITQSASPPASSTYKPTPTATTSNLAPSTPASKCPAELGQNYEYPHLIVPVDSNKKDQTMGTSYFGEVSSSVSSLFNFDIPSADSGKQCTLMFLFPEQRQLETSSYTITGSGQITVDTLKSPAAQQNSFSNMPATSQHVGEFDVKPGNAYTISKFSCPSGSTIGYKLSSKGGDLNLRYFQDYNPCPIGLYITVS